MQNETDKLIEEVREARKEMAEELNKLFAIIDEAKEKFKPNEKGDSTNE
jgi:hypothetical protein